MTENLLFRPARPADVEAAAPLMYSSGPAAFDYILSHQTPLDALEFVRRVFPSGKGDCGYTHHVVAEVEGKVVATAAGWTEGHLTWFMVMGALQVLSQYGLWRGLPVLRRSMQMDHCLSSPAAKEYYIGHVGVTPALRGHGIGGQLMEHMLGLARKGGWHAAVLDVSVENPRAQALYERLGFEVVAEIPSHLENSAARVPSHRKMVKPLRGA